ncbi:hypothetical protein EDD90_9492 [Streptomyces sp. Ag109_O5-1]|nr:hypothetical protein EDD90_9492 [Streptomyces sp. Ag109_O5-1]
MRAALGMTDDDRHNDPAARLERACLSRISSPVIPGPAWCRPLACADPRARRVAESPRPDTGVTHAFPYGATSDEGDGRSRGPAQRDQQVYRPVHRAGRRSSASMGSISCRSYGRFKTSVPTAVRDASTNEVERRFHARVPPTSPTREARTTSTCHCRRRRTGRPTTSGLTRKLVHCAWSAPRWNAGSCPAGTRPPLPGIKPPPHAVNWTRWQGVRPSVHTVGCDRGAASPIRGSSAP